MYSNHGNVSLQWWTGRAVTPVLVSWFLIGVSTGLHCCREETAPLRRRSWRQQPTMPQPSSSTTTPLTRLSRWDTKVRVCMLHRPTKLSELHVGKRVNRDKMLIYFCVLGLQITPHLSYNTTVQLWANKYTSDWVWLKLSSDLFWQDSSKQIEEPSSCYNWFDVN